MREFVWVDGERTIHFGPAADAVEPLGGPGFTLLTTRARGGRGAVDRRGRGRVHEVGRGQVHELAGGLLAVRRRPAPGGGRVVALAAAAAATPGKAARGARGGEVRALAVRRRSRAPR